MKKILTILLFNLILSGLLPDSRQGDREFAGLLREMGAEVAWDGGEMIVRGRARRIGGSPRRG